MAQEKTVRPRRSITIYRLDALPIPALRREVIQGLLAAGEIAAIVAPAGDGKSAIAQLLVTCVAEGRPFFGRQVIAGPAIYLAAERGNESKRRLLTIKAAGIYPLYIADGRLNLADLDEVDEFATTITARCKHPSLIVIDTLARCMPGLEENSARDMGKVVDGLTQLLEKVPTAAIVFVHHAGKGGSGAMRGSTALIGAVDLEMRVEKKGKLRRLIVSKANAIAEGQHFTFDLVPVRCHGQSTSDLGEVITAVELEVDAAAVTACHGQASRSEIILELIRDLAKNGSVDRRSCLAAARDQQLITGKTMESTAEQFRRVLIQLRDAEIITFDERQITLATAANPNIPNGPPKGGLVGEVDWG